MSEGAEIREMDATDLVGQLVNRAKLCHMIRFQFRDRRDSEMTLYQFATISRIVRAEWGAEYEITDHWFKDDDGMPSWCVVLRQQRNRMPRIYYHIDVNGTVRSAEREKARHP